MKLPPPLKLAHYTILGDLCRSCINPKLTTAIAISFFSSNELAVQNLPPQKKVRRSKPSTYCIQGVIGVVRVLMRFRVVIPREEAIADNNLENGNGRRIAFHLLVFGRCLCVVKGVPLLRMG